MIQNYCHHTSLPPPTSNFLVVRQKSIQCDNILPWLNGDNSLEIDFGNNPVKALEILSRLEEHLFLFIWSDKLTNLLNFFSLEPLWIEAYLRQSAIRYLSLIHTQICQRDLQCWTWSTLWPPKLPCRACQKGRISQWWLKARLPSCRKCPEQLCISCCQVSEALSCTWFPIFPWATRASFSDSAAWFITEGDRAPTQAEQLKETTWFLSN